MLNFSAPRLGAAPDPTPIDDAAEFFAALQEQLGLKLQPEKTSVPVFVIDEIERPSEIDMAIPTVDTTPCGGTHGSSPAR